MKEILFQIIMNPATQQFLATLAVGVTSFLLAKRLSEPYRQTLYMLLCIIESWDKTVDVIPETGKVINEERVVRIKEAVAKSLTAEQKKIVDNFLSAKGFLNQSGKSTIGNWEDAPEIK